MALFYVAQLVGEHTSDVVQSRRLTPRWDLATHIVYGWQDYNLLATGRIPQLLWDLWLQGYWPPVPSIYQIPFYLLLGGGIAAALWSSLTAFVLVGLIGAAVLWRQRGNDAAGLSASVFVALLISSPFLLAYASLTMTEMPGALAQMLVLFCYAAYRRHPEPRTARWFAISLTLLFFTKYNYFLLVVGPLVLFEWLERTADRGASGRLASLRLAARRVLSSPTGIFIVLYLAFVLMVMRTGGFEFHLAGRRISVRSIGNTGYAVLYFLLARLWFAHRRGRIDWRRLTAADPRVRALLVWFVVPVTVWLASPYPNHLRDFANLVVNLPDGDPTVGTGLVTYLNSLRRSYFYSPWVLVFVAGAVAVAAVRYRDQPPVVQWLLLAIPLQFVAVAVHPSRFPRYMLLTVVLLCLAAASEIGRWFAGSSGRRMAAALLAPLVLAGGVVAARRVVVDERFRTVAFEHYTDSDALRSALQVIRGELGADDRLAIVGQNNELSQALFRWELGPPTNVPCFPVETAGVNRVDLSRVTLVLVISPLGSAGVASDAPDYYTAQFRSVYERVDRGELRLRHQLPIEDLDATLRLYRRTSDPPERVGCEW